MDQSPQSPSQAPSPEVLNSRTSREYSGLDMQSESTKLMTEVKGGNEAAFDTLVSMMRNQAFHVARSLVGSREDALDLAQETFLKIFRARETYRDGEPFLPWFHRILRNTCFSFLRRERRVSKTSLSAKAEENDGDWEIVDERVPSPSDRLERSEQSDVFRAAFERLGARDREIIALRHFEELSYREIAETLDIPQGTVMSRLFHARRKLRDIIGDQLEADPGGLEPPILETTGNR